MLKIGLTGGIASGKSEAARHFAAQGAAVIDTDQLARDVLSPGTPALQEVAHAFGRQILLPDGTLSRRALRHIIFSDPEARKRLEAITHPRIVALLRKRLEALSQAPYVVVEIPLLAESELTGELDRILVIDTPEEAQVERLMRRDDESMDKARAALGAQGSRPSRLELADDVIVNDEGLDKLRSDVRTLHERYLRLARRQPQDCYNPDS